MDSYRVIILGAGGHARVVADAVRASGGQVVAWADRKSGYLQQIDGIPVIGEEEALARREEVSYVIGIGDNAIRRRLAEQYSLNWQTVCHPSAVISASAIIGPGSVILPGAVVNAGAVIGAHCIINTHAVAEHDARIGAFTHLSPGAVLGGNVTLGEEVHIALGATVRNQISIASGTVVGAGAVVVRDISQSGVYVGVPARKIK